jgi:ATP-binding cassette subfamily F protein uup
LAKLFAKPANVIVLDEPTNDLDAETLELLEDRLVQFEGTVLVVSHDRAFLNNVVAGVIVFEGGTIKEYVGGYDDWLRQRPSAQTPLADNNRKSGGNARKSNGSVPADATAVKRRLSYKERQELTTLPATIEQLEAEIGALHGDMAQPQYYQRPSDQIVKDQSQLKQLEMQLAASYQRWEELEQFAEK